MDSRKEIAVEKNRCRTHNCAQAVLTTYCDYANMDEASMMNLGNAYGAGMGNTEGTCGALVGVGAIIGLVAQEKATAMKEMASVMKKFQDRNGATQCKLLKGIPTGNVLRQCPDCIADACEFLEEALCNMQAK